MATLYIVEQGAKLEKELKKLVVTKNNETLLEIPEFKIDRVLLFGNIQLTTQAIRFLLESGIDTSFFSTFGKLKGRLTPIASKNIYLRLAQYERSKDNDFTIQTAKTIVEGKIKNSKVMLQRYDRNHPEEAEFSTSLNNLDSCLVELPNKTKVSSIMGVEGRAAAIYFEAFGKMFRKELRFSVRTRRPPLDPINALLSLGYALVTNELFSLAFATGFDPYIGFLHGIEYCRPSLALDLVEEFRHPVVDRLTLELVNKEVLGAGDFEEKDGGVCLKDESRKKYFKHYEKRMLTCFHDQSDNEEINYRKLFYKQVQKFAKTVQEKTPYDPFLMK